jgi:hypothetical protein
MRPMCVATCQSPPVSWDMAAWAPICHALPSLCVLCALHQIGFGHFNIRRQQSVAITGGSSSGSVVKHAS